MIECIILCMIVINKDKIMAMEEGSEVMSFFLNYPATDNITDIINGAFEVKQKIEKYSPEVDITS